MILWYGKKVEDLNCMNHQRKFLCQIDPCKSTRHKCPSNSAHSKPPDGYVYISQAGKYYRPYRDTKSWYDAQVQCSAREATLVEGKTAEEHDVFPIMKGKIYDGQF